MLRSMILLAASGIALTATLPAQAQYYREYPDPYYDDRRPPPPRYYRDRRYGDGYYGGNPYQDRRYYEPRAQQWPPGFRGDPRSDPRQVMRDPRTGATYCVFPNYTVQDGECRPYTGR